MKRRVAASILGAAAAIALAAIAGSAGARGYSQPERVRVATTGNRSELLSTIDISPVPGVGRQVVMSLSPGELRRLRSGDRLRASSELEVTTDCLSQSPRCVGEPYTYDPTVSTRLVLAPDAATTGGPATAPISELRQRTCVQHNPDRQHHCVLVFAHSSLDVSTATLPCAPDACYVNLVADAYNPLAQSGDKLIIGEDEPDGTTRQDKGRVNAVRLRPSAPGPEPRKKVRTFLDRGPDVNRLQVGSNQAGLNKTVVFSQRVGRLRRRTQLEVNAKTRSDISQLPYRVLVKSTLVLTTGPKATRASPLARRVATTKGEIAEGNGFNCTQADTPCLTTKVGVGRLLQGARNVSGSLVPLYVNLVVGTKALKADPQPGDAVKVVGGNLRVVRYPPARFG